MTDNMVSFDDMIVWYNHGHRDALTGKTCDPQTEALVLKRSYKTGYQEALQRLAEQLTILGKAHHLEAMTATATYLQDYAKEIK